MEEYKFEITMTVNIPEEFTLDEDDIIQAIEDKILSVCPECSAGNINAREVR